MLCHRGKWQPYRQASRSRFHGGGFFGPHQFKQLGFFELAITVEHGQRAGLLPGDQIFDTYHGAAIGNPPLHFFGNQFPLQELQQIIRAARF